MPFQKEERRGFSTTAAYFQTEKS